MATLHYYSILYFFFLTIIPNCLPSNRLVSFKNFIQYLAGELPSKLDCFTYIVDGNTSLNLIHLFHENILYPSTVISLNSNDSEFRQSSTVSFNHRTTYVILTSTNSALTDIITSITRNSSPNIRFIFLYPVKSYPSKLFHLLIHFKSLFLDFTSNPSQPLIRLQTLTTNNSVLHLRTINIWNGTHLKYNKNPFDPTTLEKTSKPCLKICAFQLPPHVLEHNGDFTGIEVSLVRAFAATLGISAEFYRPPNNEKWGDEINGTWSGMFGQVQQGLADIGIANIFLTLPRYYTFDMSYPYDIDNANFAVRKPEPYPQWQALLTPFTPTLWLATGMAFIICGLCLILLVECFTYVQPFRSPGIFHRRLSEAYFYMVQALTGIAGSESASNPTSIQAYLSIIWAVFFFITSGYKASLTASLSIPRMPSPIDTNQQLLQSGLDLGCVGMEMKSLFMSLEDPIVRQIGMRYTAVASIEDGIRRAADGSYAFMENRVFLQYAASTSFLDSYGTPTLHLLKEGIMPFPISLALPKNSPYKTHLDQVIMRTMQNGLLQYWQQEAIRQAPKTSLTELKIESEEADPLILSIYDLEGGFLLLTFCYIPCVIAFVIEIRCNTAAKM